MEKKYDERAVWPWEYSYGNAYEWPFRNNPKKIKKEGGKNE
jgi:hypothetical protein